MKPGSTEENRRAFGRRDTLFYLRVFDAQGIELGRATNLSGSGILLWHRESLAAGAPLDLLLELPRSYGAGARLSVTAVCRWSQRGDGEEYARSGMEFVGESEAKRAMLQRLADRLALADLSA